MSLKKRVSLKNTYLFQLAYRVKKAPFSCSVKTALFCALLRVTSCVGLIPKSEIRNPKSEIYSCGTQLLMLAGEVFQSGLSTQLNSLSLQA